MLTFITTTTTIIIINSSYLHQHQHHHSKHAWPLTTRGALYGERLKFSCGFVKTLHRTKTKGSPRLEAENQHIEHLDRRKNIWLKNACIVQIK
jgi:hypothetical protein